MPNSKKILLIDDDRDHLAICELVLKRKGYEVLTLLGCNDTQEMLRVTEAFLPGLIFIDHNMPEIGGVEAAKMLKSRPALSAIPVIYFSADSDIAILAAQAGAVNYLKKPFQFERLLDMAGAYLG